MWVLYKNKGSQGFPFPATVPNTQTLDVQKVPRNVAEEAEKISTDTLREKGHLPIVLQANKEGKYNLNVTIIQIWL